MTVIGLVVAATSDWRAGLRIIAGTLSVAALLRLTLPEEDAGMLAVRHRFFDVGVLIAFSAALFALALTVPEQAP